MNTQKNTSPGNFNARLIALVIALVVGFGAGWLKGNATSTQTTDTSSSGVIAQQESSETSATDEQNRSATSTSTSDDSQSTQTTSTDSSSDDSGSSTVAPTRGPTVEEDGWYTSKDEVALYIHTYGHLPGNFISKTKARARGWVSSEGNLDEVCPGMSIGGSEFYNDEGQLPDKQGRRWTECDINYTGGYRGAERIVFSNDGLIFYTADHYTTFEQLY